MAWDRAESPRWRKTLDLVPPLWGKGRTMVANETTMEAPMALARTLFTPEHEQYRDALRRFLDKASGCDQKLFTEDEFMEFYRLIGYSLSGFADIFGGFNGRQWFKDMSDSEGTVY
jgi:hypothetical protein